MSKIGDFFTWIFISLFLVWMTGLIFAGDQCTRVHRSAWIVTYPMVGVELITKYWTTDASKLDLLLWKANGAISVEKVFEKTVYGDKSKCNK